LFSLLDDTFEDNKKIPLKWQYFGSEKGILNQFPSSKPSDCSSYDNRFRPWYKASATPNPKDVVIVIKNNPFDHTRRLFEAADIILRTLNPRDRVAMVIYNDEIARNVIGGCYATNLSLATPANVNLFQYFLKTAPDPKSGNRMSLALETAYKYYDHDIDLDGILINGTHVNASHPNITRRDRAIVFLTDGHRLTDGEKEKTMEVLKTYCDRLTMVSIFVLVTHSNDVSLGQEMMYFLSVVVASVYQGTEEVAHTHTLTHTHVHMHTCIRTHMHINIRSLSYAESDPARPKGGPEAVYYTVLCQVCFSGTALICLQACLYGSLL
jgi:hypothetical protein